MEFRQLLPEPGQVDVGRLLTSLDLGARAPDGRPCTIVNFVSSADGRATVEGRSGGLGDDGDRAMFHGLREQVDAVMVGTGTLRAETYGRILRRPERRERRVELGLSPEPIACIVSRSGDLPADIPLFSEPEAKVVIFSSIELETSNWDAEVDVIRLDAGQLTLTTVLRLLYAEYGVRSLLCEGGPTLFGALLHERVVDELFLTLSPKLTGGGTGPTISSGPELMNPRRMSIEWLLERNGSLYLRYRVAG